MTEQKSNYMIFKRKAKYLERNSPVLEKRYTKVTKEIIIETLLIF